MNTHTPNQVIDSRIAIVNGKALKISGCNQANRCPRGPHCLRANTLLIKRTICEATGQGDCSAFITEEKVVARSPAAKVLYSSNEAATMDGAGFWNIKKGWVDLEDATRFTDEQTHNYNVPMSLGQDRHWIIDPACQHLITDEQTEAGDTRDSH